MRTLFHFWLSPGCRKVRMALYEKKLEFDPVVERVWEARPEFLAISPHAEVPVLVEPDGTTLLDATAICEYLDEIQMEPPLLGFDPLTRAEVRRLVGWFDGCFGREVTDNLVGEKMLKRLYGHGGPDSRAIRAGYANIHRHMEYIGWLIEHRRCLAGDAFSMADITAAAHVSAIDYLGDVPWENHPAARDWYARIKSRPSFRTILGDHVPGMPPPKHYSDPDF
ncbi:MAG: glutathione S-transferase family protein [Alphaproteobacteria bacterium]|nr:glutathione S-transferase family protein [Alphaproteobacteria bacterium]